MAANGTAEVSRHSGPRRSESGREDRLLARAARRGFTLIELMVVVAILGTLLALLLPVLGRASKQRAVVMAHAEVKAIHAAMEAYKEGLGVYPPDTDDYGTGVAKEDDIKNGKPNIDRYMICEYLASALQDPNTKKTYGPFFVIDPNHTERLLDEGNKVDLQHYIYRDPWGQPYHVDAVHSDANDTTGNVTIVGEPYPPGMTSAEAMARKVENVKVWSCGPDGVYVNGSNVDEIQLIQDGKNPKGSDPDDQDNITSWAN